MTVLYEFPPTRSQRAKWVLEELGVDEPLIADVLALVETTRDAVFGREVAE